MGGASTTYLPRELLLDVMQQVNYIIQSFIKSSIFYIRLSEVSSSCPVVH